MKRLLRLEDRCDDASFEKEEVLAFLIERSGLNEVGEWEMRVAIPFGDCWGPPPWGGLEPPLLDAHGIYIVVGEGPVESFEYTFDFIYVGMAPPPTAVRPGSTIQQRWESQEKPGTWGHHIIDRLNGVTEIPDIESLGNGFKFDDGCYVLCSKRLRGWDGTSEGLAKIESALIEILSPRANRQNEPLRPFKWAYRKLTDRISSLKTPEDVYQWVEMRDALFDAVNTYEESNFLEMRSRLRDLSYGDFSYRANYKGPAFLDNGKNFRDMHGRDITRAIDAALGLTPAAESIKPLMLAPAKTSPEEFSIDEFERQITHIKENFETRQLSIKDAAQNGNNWGEASYERLMLSRSQSAAPEKVRRCVEAIKLHNSTRELSEKWKITPTVVMLMSGVRQATVTQWLEAHQADIDAANTGMDYHHNRNKGRAPWAEIFWEGSLYREKLNATAQASRRSSSIKEKAEHRITSLASGRSRIENAIELISIHNEGADVKISPTKITVAKVAGMRPNTCCDLWDSELEQYAQAVNTEHGVDTYTNRAIGKEALEAITEDLKVRYSGLGAFPRIAKAAL
jgi:hypothetical protein